MTDKTIFRVGSRKSQLAIIQTNEVIAQLKKLHPNKEFEIVEMSTFGDKILDKPLPKIGEKSLFTRELEDALLNDGVDFVVHSLKDLPTTLPTGLTIGAVLEREDPRDVLILHSKYDGENLETLPKGSVIGTSSLRRTAQLCRNSPHLKIHNIRGNLNTRLKKLDEDKIYSGIVLAAAGVKRMKWEERIREYLEPSKFLYAVGQGAIAVECRSGDDMVIGILEKLNHIPTILRVVCERSFLKTLGGGCSAPVAVHSTFCEKTLSITGAVWSLDGAKTIKKNRKVDVHSDDSEPPRKYLNLERKSHVGMSISNIDESDIIAAEDLGRKLAEDMIAVGALDIIDEAKLLNDNPDSVVTEKNNISNDSNTIRNGDKR